MELKSLKPRLALNKAFLKVKPNRPEIELFKKNLIRMIDTINESESEEFHKNEVSKFLQNTYYTTNHYINTKDRKDLVIHNGNAANSTVGVIIEAKKPVNKAEMLKPDNINTKAFQELLLYYLRERITHKNLEIKHLIATNIYEWYIFDAQLFEKIFAQNKSLVKNFVDFEEGRLGGSTTDFFYSEIAAPAISAIGQDISFTYFDIRDYEKPLRNDNPKDDTLLIALYKLLSPQHLLKQPFANDSNTLDKAFYTELLHMIGLTEIKEGSKKLIQRKKEGERNAGSLLESAILQLDNLDKITRLNKPSLFGNSYDERLFNVALELSITWVNRILFLKLLEAQLIKYHKGDKSFAFLNTDKVKNFDDLNTLFFQVLAKRTDERSEAVMKLFADVPYLNSSLFEPSEIEHSCLFISQLADSNISILSNTVIKDNTGKKRTGEMPVVEYIFEFLNAYDFSSEGSEEIQEDNKRLINASVLGLIFEKINGYKDGSFFTPGFITMYMCRETIRRAVLQKFNDTKGWNCNEFGELYDKIDAGTEARLEANTIINNLRICDPAVGSGHFLVSALNEMIAIKSELRILQDREGKRLKEYNVQVENDELVVTDDDGLLFEYNPNSKESQRVQETLFHEKQTIIENCLFGVDINPNSVKICRLRLWIELLKNAYYRTTDVLETSHALSLQGNRELETLPNIDINIKCGNSLISRYALDADIKKALKRSKWTIDSYRLAVMQYRNARSKDEKREMERLIASIKNDFESEVALNDKRVMQLNILRGELYNLSNQTSLFDMSKAEKAKFNKAVAEKTTKINKLETELDEIRNNKIYENAFEWRFEFPEVLNDEGGFVGFDVVIGNPPYILVQDLGNIDVFAFYKSNYNTAVYKIDTYALFYEKGIDILSEKGKLGFITPNTLLKNKHAKELRLLLLSFSIDEIINFYKQVFDDASVDTLILFLTKETPHMEHSFMFYPYKDNMTDLYATNKVKHNQNQFLKDNFEIILEIDGNVGRLLGKIECNTKPLKQFGRSYFGIQTYDRKIYETV
ncbi:MAG: Eco57I restriction-modification methylase domain-containing protein [Paludibacter sp.]|nr:Eco57I restriction-modification methylase domain-containing protein [Paludibacter sp.]